MKKQMRLLFSLISIIIFQSCSSNDPEPKPTPAPTPTPTPVAEFNYTSSNTYNLNVVYFVPNDVTPPKDYHRRLSEILLSTQEFYGKEMERNGYGYKPFGLLKDDIKKRIKLIVIAGSKGGAGYPYSGGNGAVQTDISNYRAAHPSEFTGDHYLVIIPATTYDAN